MKKIVLLAVLFLFLSSGLSYAIQCKDYFDYFDECNDAGFDPFKIWEKQTESYNSVDTVMVGYLKETMKNEEEQCINLWRAKQRLKELKKKKRS